MVTVPFVRYVLAILTCQIYTVRGDSMTPAFRRGDRLLISRIAYLSGVPNRGDVVIVRNPREPDRRYLKRAVGLPGEEVRLQDGMLYVEGAHMPEPYLGGLPASPGLGDRAWKPGDNEYFVMGDNRAHSTDGRDFGPVKLGLIVGRAWFRCWPLRRWGRIR